MDTTPHDQARGAGAFIARETLLRALVIGILSLAAVSEIARIAIAARSAKAATVDQQPGSRGTSGIAGNSADSKLSVLVGAHLFGVGTQSVIQTSPPVASPQWTLSGTLAGSSPSAGSAIVFERGKSPVLRTVGEEISNGFKLLQVRADTVTLIRDGQRVMVSFSKSHAAQGGIVVAASMRTEPPVAAAMPAVWHPHKGWPQNRPPALVMLRPQVHLGPNGHYNGMQVMGTGNASALSALGLQRGDVITQVNGKPLRQPGDAQLALVQMSTRTPVTVTVERGGTTQELAVAIPDDRD
jgi:general secretion pathway protein C